MRAEDICYNLQTQGFCAVPNQLSAQKCADLKSLLAQTVDSYVPVLGSVRSGQDKYNLHDLLLLHADFAQIMDHDLLDAVLGHFLGEFWTMYAYTSSSLPPKATNYARRLHVDSPRWVAGYPSNFGVMWALDEFSADNGAPEFLAGSHNSPSVPTESYFEAHCETLSCPQGSMVLFDARCFHRAGLNGTDKWRHALTMNACRSFMKQRMDWPKMIPADFLPHFSSRLERILGFHTRVPQSMQELFLPEDQRLYRANQG